jgi:hypothetical protein
MQSVYCPGLYDRIRNLSCHNIRLTSKCKLIVISLSFELRHSSTILDVSSKLARIVSRVFTEMVTKAMLNNLFRNSTT